MSVQVTNYAASLTDVFVPDRQGRFEHVVLGFDSLECYLGRHPKLGATVGRFANRIKNAEFCLNGQTYHLYNPQIKISAESETKRSIFREKDKTKRSKKESAQHSKSRNKSFVMTSVSAL